MYLTVGKQFQNLLIHVKPVPLAAGAFDPKLVISEIVRLLTNEITALLTLTNKITAFADEQKPG